MAELLRLGIGREMRYGGSKFVDPGNGIRFTLEGLAHLRRPVAQYHDDEPTPGWNQPSGECRACRRSTRPEATRCPVHQNINSMPTAVI